MDKIIYLSKIPCTTKDVQASNLSIANETEGLISIKTTDVNGFLPLLKGDNRGTALFCVDEDNTYCTYPDCIMSPASHSRINSSIITATKSIVCTSTQNGRNYETKYKIKSFSYHHDALNEIYQIPHQEFSKDLDDKYIQIKAVKELASNLGIITYKKSKLTCAHKMRNSYTPDGSNALEIRYDSYLEFTCSKALKFEDVMDICHKLDAVMHLMTSTPRRFSYIEFIDADAYSYAYRDLDQIKENNTYTSRIRLIEGLNKKSIVKLLDTLLLMDDNAIFPIVEYTRRQSLEIQFLELYRTLEYIEPLIAKDREDSTFLMNYFKTYTAEVKKIFGPNVQMWKLVFELKKIRNKYSHDGYFLGKITLEHREKKQKWTVTVDSEYMKKAVTLLRTIMYTVIYQKSQITPLPKGMQEN